MITMQCVECGATVDKAARQCPICGIDPYVGFDPERDAFAILRKCRVLGGHGLALKPDERRTAVFCFDELLLRKKGHADVHVSYSEIMALEIGGPGAESSGGGFIGGGFGLAGMAEGMLIGAALNMLATTTTIDTVICLRTDAAKLFLHTQDFTPDALRTQLSVVFSILREQEESRALPAAPPNACGDPVDRLAKLADLLEKGLITQEESDTLKAELLS